MMDESVASRAALAAQIDRELPQTQCRKCGFEGCAPYAQAIADGRADHNRCPPGGQEGIARLARVLGRQSLPPLALDASCGAERPRPLAVIDESLCIGCTLCIQACPVDAILGAPKLMHTVLESLCTGCDLCVAPCPVDCIEMVPISGAQTGWQAWSEQQADEARARYVARNERLRAQAAAASGQPGPVAPAPQTRSADSDGAAAKRAIVAAAMARALAVRASAARAAEAVADGRPIDAAPNGGEPS